MLEQTDPLMFETYLTELIQRLKEKEGTRSFAAYFDLNWVPHKKEWGYAYRVGAGINTNMFCEAFHRVFKYKYLNGKVNVCAFFLNLRLDAGIQSALLGLYREILQILLREKYPSKQSAHLRMAYIGRVYRFF